MEKIDSFLINTPSAIRVFLWKDGDKMIIDFGVINFRLIYHGADVAALTESFRALSEGDAWEQHIFDPTYEGEKKP